MIDVNQLKSLMDLYKANVRDPNNWPGRTNSGFQPVSFDFGGQALDWARDTLAQGGGEQNFFADRQHTMPTYRAPAVFDEQPPEDPTRGKTMNFLMNLLGKR